MVSFRGKKKLGPCPDWSPLGVYFKISDEHPHSFYMRSPPFWGDVILVVRSVYKQSREKQQHFSLYVQNISGYREKKKRSLKYQHKLSFQISRCHHLKIIVNQNE